MANVDMDALMSRSMELELLIDDTQLLLDTPLEFNKTQELLTNITSKIAHNDGMKAKVLQELRIAVQSGDPRKIISGVAIGGSVLVAVFVGSAVYEASTTIYAKKKAKQALLPAYKELTAKLSLLVQQQQKINQQLVALGEESDKEKEALKQQLEKLTDVIERITKLQAAVEH